VVYDGNDVNKTAKPKLSNPPSKVIYAQVCRDMISMGLRYSAKYCHEVVLLKMVYSKEKLQ
jgi:hypothetical protein